MTSSRHKQRKSWNTAELEASQRSGEGSNSAGAPATGTHLPVPNSEVTARPERRRFTAEYKRSIVEEADASRDAVAIGALLRREGLYSSHSQSQRGELAALAPKKRGPKVVVSRLVLENRKLVVAGTPV